MSDKVTLYSYTKSSCSWRIRIALNLKKIDYEYKPVFLSSTSKGEQTRPDFVALNPSGQVPVLHIDGLHLSESVAIAEYLEETRPQHPLFPPTSDPAARARVRTIVEIINSAIQPRHNLSVVSYLESDFDPNDPNARKKWSAHWVVHGFTAIEKLLSDWAGTYCIGDSITFADCCLVPQVYAAYRYDVDVKQFPTIWRVFSSLDTLPEVQAAHASQQPDAQ